MRMLLQIQQQRRWNQIQRSYPYQISQLLYQQSQVADLEVRDNHLDKDYRNPRDCTDSIDLHNHNRFGLVFFHIQKQPHWQEH